jgi:hypothetical protein
MYARQTTLVIDRSYVEEAIRPERMVSHPR